MTTAQVPMLIAGRMETIAADRYGDVFNPSSGCVQAEVPFATVEDIVGELEPLNP